MINDYKAVDIYYLESPKGSSSINDYKYNRYGNDICEFFLEGEPERKGQEVVWNPSSIRRFKSIRSGILDLSKRPGQGLDLLGGSLQNTYVCTSKNVYL